VLEPREWIRKALKSNKLPLVIIVLVIGSFTCFYVLTPPLGNGYASDGILVPVLLFTAPQGSSLSFSVQGPYKIFAGGERLSYAAPASLYSGLKLDEARVALAGPEMLEINGKPIPAREAVIVPESQGVLEAQGRRYGGLFQIRVTRGGELRLLNIVELEAYLAGVLFKEMPANYPEEALKAQAVAARTYTLHRLRSGSDFLTDDTRSQVYGGLTAVTDQSRRIVDATRGEVLMYEGEILPAYYSSTCGGTTARASDAFLGASAAPVDTSRVCGYCSDSPFYRWRAVFTLAEIRERFGVKQDLEVGVTGWDSMRRATEIALLDGRGRVIDRYPAETFRYLLNQGRPLDQRVLSTRIDRITSKDGAVIFEGKGWGHGVGLCQYGARGLARAGKNYRQILDYYYEGAELVSGYGGL
jgi:stage II sporulation protein D